MLVTIDGVKIFITHGHEQNVKYEYEFMTLRKAAEKYDPDLIIFGHTHIPYTDYKGKATLLNREVYVIQAHMQRLKSKTVN